MSASWYEVLGVSRDASADEIRGAWRDAIADFDPTDRRFGLYNDAAKVLLDAEARAAYDRTLPADAPADEAPAAGVSGEDGAADATPVEDLLADDDLDDLDEDDEEFDESIDDDSIDDDLEELDPNALPAEPRAALDGALADRDKDRDRPQRPVPAWLLIALALATLVCAGVAGYFQFAADDSDQTEDAVVAARTAASEHFGDVLTYRWDDLEAGRKRAEAILTPAYYENEFAKIWELVQASAAELKAVVTTDVLATGVVRASDDGQRVELVTVLRNKVTNSGGDQGTGIIMVGVTMVKKGGSWLVDDISGIGDSDAGEAPSTEQPSGSPSATAPAN